MKISFLFTAVIIGCAIINGIIYVSFLLKKCGPDLCTLNILYCVTSLLTLSCVIVFGFYVTFYKESDTMTNCTCTTDRTIFILIFVVMMIVLVITIIQVIFLLIVYSWYYRCLEKDES